MANGTFSMKFYTYMEPQTQEQVQARVDALSAADFQQALVYRLYAVVCDQFQPFYEETGGHTPNAVWLTALARRMARENSLDTEIDERALLGVMEIKENEAREARLFTED